MAGQPVIDLGSLVLRDFTPGDVPLVQSASATTIPDSTTVPRTPGRAEALEYVERQRGRLTSGVGYAYCIAVASNDLAVGYVGLQLRDVERGRASLGYWIGPEHRGHGYAAQALTGLSDWSDRTLDIPRLELYVEPWNTASSRGTPRRSAPRSRQASSARACCGRGSPSPASARTCGCTPGCGLSGCRSRSRRSAPER